MEFCSLGVELRGKKRSRGIKNKLKAKDVGEGHQLSISAGHCDIPFLTVTPQDSNSAEWALPRLSLLPPKGTATVPNLQLLSPLPILHPAGRAAPQDPSPAPWQGEGIIIILLLPVSGTGAPHPSFSPAPGQGGLCHRDPGALVLPNLLSVLQGQGWGTLRGHRQNDPAGFRAQREDMDLHTRGCTHECFSSLVMVNLSC